MNRRVYWGNSGITFYQNSREVKKIFFSVGPQGPVDGTIGSPLRKKYQKMCQEWVEKGTLPK